jgi:ActR/RegA family two-component response regulator
MMRLVMLDDDPEHGLLLTLIARTIDAQVVARVSDVEALEQAIDTLRPDALVLDLWLGQEKSLDRLDDILRMARDCRIVVWTYDPWTARPYVVDTNIDVIDKMSSPQELLRNLQTVA